MHVAARPPRDTPCATCHAGDVILGIDLGTTNSSVAITIGGETYMLPVDDGFT